MVRSCAFAILFLALLAFGHDTNPSRTGTYTSARPQNAGLRAAYVAAVQREVTDEYRALRTADGLAATNAAHGLRADIGARTVAIAPFGGGAWSWQAAATRFGREGALTELAGAEPAAFGNRIELDRGALREWYFNGPLGLEQGFTLPAPPPGGRPGSAAVVIELGGGGDLHAVVSATGDAARLDDASGRAVLRYADLYATDATGRPLPALLAAGPRGLSIRLDDAGAVYPIEVDPLISQQAKLVAGDGGPGDEFGTSVALSGNTAIIGAGVKRAAYVFVRNGATWTPQQELKASDGYEHDGFGHSIALSGDTALVGAWEDPKNPGSVYAFVRSGGTWTQQQKLVAGAPGDNFGTAVALEGNTAIIGGWQLLTLQGVAYVYVRAGGVWAQQQILIPDDGIAGDHFGEFVAVSADTAVIGAWQKDAGERGAAYVYVRSGGVWTQQQELKAGDSLAGDLFGRSVAVNGDTVLVGATGKGLSQGAAYVFTRSGGVWTQQQELFSNDGAPGDEFGGSAALKGDLALVGAFGKAATQGVTYVFARSAGTWTQQQVLAPNDAAPTDQFGWTTAIDGTTALIGALTKASSRGAAYVFALPADDGEGCVSASQCQSGFCVAGVCCSTACNGACQGCSKAAGAPVDGTCAPLSGTACSAGGGCTVNGTCHSGVCTGGAPKTCQAEDACHQAGTCDPASGTCSNPAKPDGTACAGGACVGGVCEPQGSPSASSGTDSGATASGAGAGGGSMAGAGGGGSKASGGGHHVPFAFGGCGCSTSASPGGTLLAVGALLLLLLLLSTRRRRSPA